MAGRSLKEIPGVGKAMAEDLQELGLSFVEDLKGQNPQELYDRLCILQNIKLDRCVLYVFRCAVYYAENTEYETNLLKWWSWKDKAHPNENIKE